MIVRRLDSDTSQQAYTDELDDPLPPAPSMVNTQPSVPASYLYRARVVYDYEALKADELNLHIGAIVYVVRRNDDGWHEGILNGVTGLFPENYVEMLA